MKNFGLIGRTALIITLASVLVTIPGCTSRGLTITSNPPGAEVTVNHRVVGVTPVHIGFTHYGTYHIELRKEKYEVIVKDEKFNPPAYGYEPITLATDNLIPAKLNDEIYLNYVLKPLDETPTSSRDKLLERAALARNGTVTNPRTGQEVHIALNRPDKPAAVVAVDTEGDGKTPAKNIAGDIKGIDATKPEGLRLAKELGLSAEKDKTSAANKTEASKTKDTRVPKAEELIFDKPKPAEPEKKK